MPRQGGGRVVDDLEHAVAADEVVARSAAGQPRTRCRSAGHRGRRRGRRCRRRHPGGRGPGRPRRSRRPAVARAARALGLGSTTVTSWPSSASGTARPPVPPPRSSTRRGRPSSAWRSWTRSRTSSHTPGCAARCPGRTAGRRGAAAVRWLVGHEVLPPAGCFGWASAAAAGFWRGVGSVAEVRRGSGRRATGLIVVLTLVARASGAGVPELARRRPRSCQLPPSLGRSSARVPGVAGVAGLTRSPCRPRPRARRRRPVGHGAGGGQGPPTAQALPRRLDVGIRRLPEPGRVDEHPPRPLGQRASAHAAGAAGAPDPAEPDVGELLAVRPALGTGRGRRPAGRSPRRPRPPALRRCRRPGRGPRRRPGGPVRRPAPPRPGRRRCGRSPRGPHGRSPRARPRDPRASSRPTARTAPRRRSPGRRSPAARCAG